MKHKVKSALLTLTILLSTSCSDQDISNGEPTITRQQNYRVEWIANRPLIDRSYLSIRLEKNLTAHGRVGCNTWAAKYQLQGHHLSFSQLTFTQKYCSPALMEQETRFLQTLKHVNRWDFSPINQLQLWTTTEEKPIKLWAE